MILLLAFVACNSDDDNNDGNATFSVKMVDSPGGYDAVNVDIQGLTANYNGQWIDFALEAPGVYNLLDFTNGNSLLMIGDTSLAPGTMTELRLLLGENNTVIVDGLTYEMQTPSGQSSGYKVKMDPQVMEADGIYRLVIDFDVSKSIHPTGNGKYMLSPVVSGYLETAIGKIAGTVSPVTAAYYVEAHNATDTAGTMIDPATGQFLIGTVFPGTYDVVFTANPGYFDKTVNGIEVVAGQTTQMGIVTFP